MERRELRPFPFAIRHPEAYNGSASRLIAAANSLLRQPSPSMSSVRGRIVGCAAAFVLPLVGALGAAPARKPASLRRVAVADSGHVAAHASAELPPALRAAVDDSLRGASGKLEMRFLDGNLHTRGSGLFARIFGSAALRQPGVYIVDDSSLSRPFAFVAMRSFSDKAHDGSIGSYRIGFWPGERGHSRTAAYANPDGFIEVTRDNVSLPVSEHFQLGDFLTHGQSSVWPKYLVLHERLVDKLELVIAELEREGITVRHMTVMSGFRTPAYNADGGTTAGRSSVSRHMYGDASDVFVDNDGDGRMDDLNGDGRVDARDAQVIVDAADRVERAHPELVGGEGVYAATSAHGPFAHVDARGTRARWGLIR